MVDETVVGAAAAIREKCGDAFPKTALVLGSGLGRFGESMTVETTIPYGDIPGFPVSTVAGHHGRLLIGEAGGTPLVCMQGRMHVYEGYEPQRLAVAIRTLHTLGVERLILTNAAGSLNKHMGPGSLMVIEDHINFSGRNPLIGPNDEDYGPRFFDMTTAYDAELRAQLDEAALEANVSVHHGVYLFTPGPSFETPAEIRMFRQMGADAVGMSTAPECLVARHCGMKVAGVSVMTNLAAGISPTEITHAETIEEGEKAFDRINRLMLAFLKRLS